MTSHFWNWPWKFKQNNLIFLSLVIVGFSIEYFSGKAGVKAPAFPLNFYGLVGFTIFSTVLFYLPFSQRYIRWTLSFQFVITAVTWMGLLSVLSGFLPQGQSALPLFFEKIALSSVTSSVPYVILIVLICQSLIFACLKKLSAFSFYQIPFLLNHLGLYIIFTTALLGSGDLIRLKMDLNKGQPEWRGYQHQFGKKVELPFALRLENFEMDVYPPKLLVVNRKNGGILKDFLIFPEGKNDFLKELKLKDWDIRFEQFYSDAFQVDDHFVPVKHVGTAPAMKLEVTDKVHQTKVSGWIGSGSYIFPAKVLNVSDEFAVALANPQPKEYRSRVSFFTPDGRKGEFLLRVNQPYDLDGWKIYQYGYDEQKGQWSNLSRVEVIRDPWLPAVYMGIYMLMAGTLLMLIVKRKND